MSQCVLYIPIPIVYEIISFSNPKDQATFRTTCKLFQTFVDTNIFKTMTKTIFGPCDHKCNSCKNPKYRIDGSDCFILNPAKTHKCFNNTTHDCNQISTLFISPQDVLIDKRTNKLYVSSSRTISVIDLNENKLTRTYIHSSKH